VFAYENHHLLNCSNDVLCFIFQIFTLFVFGFYIFLFLFCFCQVVLLYELHYNFFINYFFHHILDFYYGLVVHGCYYQVDVELMYE